MPIGFDSAMKGDSTMWGFGSQIWSLITYGSRHIWGVEETNPYVLFSFSRPIALSTNLASALPR